MKRLKTSIISRYKKFLYSNSTNSPYISGDTFLQLCDVSAKNLDISSLDSLKQANSIFCESHYLKEFLEEHNRFISAKILFVGNSDKEFHEIDFKWPRSVKKMYIQNSYISDSKRIFTLPIGLENRSLGNNGVGKYHKLPYKDDTNKVLIGPFGNSHSVRQLINYEFEFFSEPGRIHFSEKRLSRLAYKKILEEYNIVACPRGNGVDTHRVWESLYYGRYPIIADDAWAKSLSYLKIPKLTVSNWSLNEVNEVRSTKLDLFNPRKIESIWEPYWKKIINES